MRGWNNTWSCCDNLQMNRFRSLQIRTGFSLLLLEKPGKYISATRKEGLHSVSTPFSEPLASAKMKKITALLNCNTKKRFTASSRVMCLQSHTFYWPGCYFYNFFLYFIDLFANGFCDPQEMRCPKVYKTTVFGSFCQMKEQRGFLFLLMHQSNFWCTL